MVIRLNSIEFNTRIYPSNIVELAINEFKEYACITCNYNNDNKKIVLSFRDLKIDFDTISNEICNYLIAVINQSIKV